ncbi:MAG: hypothetical protein NVS3B12_04590 [Acidimicrobiales bacterium]
MFAKVDITVTVWLLPAAGLGSDTVARQYAPDGAVVVVAPTWVVEVVERGAVVTTMTPPEEVGAGVVGGWLVTPPGFSAEDDVVDDAVDDGVVVRNAVSDVARVELVVVEVGAAVRSLVLSWPLAVNTVVSAKTTTSALSTPAATRADTGQSLSPPKRRTSIPPLSGSSPHSSHRRTCER